MAGYGQPSGPIHGSSVKNPGADGGGFVAAGHRRHAVEPIGRDRVALSVTATKSDSQLRTASLIDEQMRSGAASMLTMRWAPEPLSAPALKARRSPPASFVTMIVTLDATARDSATEPPSQRLGEAFQIAHLTIRKTDPRGEGAGQSAVAQPPFETFAG